MTVPQPPKSWEDKAAWARAKRTASLAKVKPKLTGIPEPDALPQNSRDLPKDILSPREIELTEKHGIKDLLALLRERKVTVEEVTRAFLRRAALAHAAVRLKPTLALSHRYADMDRPTASSSFFGIRPLSEPNTSTLCRNPWERYSDCLSPPRSIWEWSAMMSNRPRLL
jgi:amidase